MCECIQNIFFAVFSLVPPRKLHILLWILFFLAISCKAEAHHASTCVYTFSRRMYYAFVFFFGMFVRECKFAASLLYILWYTWNLHRRFACWSTFIYNVKLSLSLSLSLSQKKVFSPWYTVDICVHDSWKWT